jgi:hypothetical protein
MDITLLKEDAQQDGEPDSVCGCFLGSAGSRRPRMSDAEYVGEMIADSEIRAAPQSAKKIRQLA